MNNLYKDEKENLRNFIFNHNYPIPTIDLIRIDRIYNKNHKLLPFLK